MSRFSKLTLEHRIFSTDGQCFLLAELVEKQGKESLPYLVDALNSDWSIVRACAAKVLGQLPADVDVVEALAVAMADSDLTVRRNAVESLGMMKPVPVSAIPALLEALVDEDVLVREVALLVLQEIQNVIVAETDAGNGRSAA